MKGETHRQHKSEEKVRHGGVRVKCKAGSEIGQAREKE